MITAMTTDALDACVALYVEVFTSPPWNESWTARDARQRLTDFLATPRVHGVCTWAEDGQLIGFAVGHLERSGAEDHFLLKEMCVAPSAQRSGHGTSLLEALDEQLDDVRHWFLLTARDSDASAFYERNGFRPATRMGVFVRP